jgi:hypothetical protein
LNSSAERNRVQRAVDDRIVLIASVEYVPVASDSATKRVIACAACKNVAPVASAEIVRAFATDEEVISAFALEQIGSSAAFERVRTAGGIQVVIAVSAAQDVRRVVVERIQHGHPADDGEGVGVKGVVARPAVQRVGTVVAVEDVVRLATIEHIVACPAPDRIGPRVTGELVISRIAEQRIVPVAARKRVIAAFAE